MVQNSDLPYIVTTAGLSPIVVVIRFQSLGFGTAIPSTTTTGQVGGSGPPLVLMNSIAMAPIPIRSDVLTKSLQGSRRRRTRPISSFCSRLLPTRSPVKIRHILSLTHRSIGVLIRMGSVVDFFQRCPDRLILGHLSRCQLSDVTIRFISHGDRLGGWVLLDSGQDAVGSMKDLTH